MKLSALLLTFVIALGLSAPLAAKTKRTPRPHPRSAVKAPKVKRKPVKPKPMKFRKAKRSQSRAAKPAKVRKIKASRSV